jgi:hypothetical protein
VITVDKKAYSSNAHSKYQKIIKYYKAHPIKYMHMIQDSFDIKLTFIQKILLIPVLHWNLKNRLSETTR